MKNKKLLVAMLFLVFMGATACEKFLQRTKEGQLTEAEALKNETDLLSFTNGIYTYFGDDDFLGGRNQILNELLGDEYNGDKFTGDYAEIYKRQNSFFGGTRDGLYSKGYVIINRSNVVLNHLDLATSEKNRIEGEAKFFRGLTHFELVKLFAQPYGYTPDNSHLGIPLRTYVSAESINRSTVKQVYDQVISDLKSAELLLPATPANGKYYTATKSAARAYLAKVYFQMNDFANAFSYADLVIKSNNFQLDSTYDKRFSEGMSKEGIFVIANKSSSPSYTPGGGLRGNFRSDQAPPGFNLTSQFYSQATQKAIDVRKAWYSNTLQAGLNVITKYNKNFFDLPIVHLTEIKLIRAEAGAETGAANLAVAISDINDILTRAYGGTTLNLSSTAAASLVISTTRSERELELVGEGNRAQEIKRIGARTGMNIDRRNSPWNCPGFILQFPKAEQDANAAFPLNPEGGCF